MRVLHAAAVPAFVLLSASAALADCPPATYSITPDPSGTSYGVIFSSMNADNNGPATCQLSVPVSDLPPGVVAVYTADYRGAVGPGDTGELTISHADGTSTTLVTDDPYFYQHLIAGRNGSIDSSIYLALLTDPGLFAALDSVDYAEIGRTTVASQQDSLAGVATGRTAVVVHLEATADLIRGGNQPKTGENSIALIGGIGSYTLGIGGRGNIDDAFSIVGGLAFIDQSVGGASANGILLSGAVRWVEPGVNTFKLFGEAGFAAAPQLGMTFSRSYQNGQPGSVTVVGNTTGSQGGLYFEGGLLYAPTSTDEIAFSGTLAQDWLQVKGYSEVASATNLFPATFADSSSGFTTVKADVAWTTAITQDVDLTLNVGVGRTFAHDGATANVAFVGPVSGTAQDAIFAEYGARLGWALNSTTSLDAFVVGTSGNTIGTHVQVGGALKMKF